MTLRIKIFSLLLLFLLISLSSVWFVLRPFYEKSLIEERISLVAQYQHFGITHSESILNVWLKSALNLGREISISPQSVEQSVNQLITLNQELISVRIIETETGEELIAENNSKEKVSLDYKNLTYYSIPEFPKTYYSLIKIAPADHSIFIVRYELSIRKKVFLVYLSFEADQIAKVLLKYPVDGEYYTSLVRDDQEILHSGNSSIVDFKTIQQVIPNMSSISEIESGNQAFVILSGELNVLGLKTILLISKNIIEEPLAEITVYALIFVIFVFILLSVGGWYLSIVMLKPVSSLMENLKPLEQLNFEPPILSAKQIEFKNLTDSLETIRQRLDNYQKINVEKIIHEEWKNKFLMNYSDSLIAIADEKGVLYFTNQRFKELLQDANVPPENLTRDRFLHDYFIISESEIIREYIESHSRITITQSIGSIDLTTGVQQFLKLQEITIYSSDGGVFSLLMFQDQTQERSIERAKNDMMNIVVHELRTPLSSILGFSEVILIESDLDEEDRKTFIGNIIKSGKKLENLINRFLDIQRLESGTLTISKVYVDTKKIVDDLVVMLTPQSESKQIKFRINKGNNLKDVPASPDLISEAFQNLMSNAIKYGPENRVVDIFLDCNATQFEFKIRDYGYGISEENQVRLFTKFYRVSNHKLSYQQVGTGLGLAYTKEIIIRHGGEIKIKSTPEIGCEFTVTLPTRIS